MIKPYQDKAAARRAYNEEQRLAGEIAAKRYRGQGKRIVHDWQGYRSITLGNGRVVFERKHEKVESPTYRELQIGAE